MFLIPHLLCFLGLLALENDTVDAAAAASAEVIQRRSCPMLWFHFNGHCYKYVSAHMIWAEAELNCVSEGANLVSVHSTGEHNFVRNLIKNFDPREGATWIGLSDIHLEGSWLWSDGSKVSFTMWYDGEPNNKDGEHCVLTNEATKWNDVQCSHAIPSVCKSRTVCSQ